MPPPLPKVKKKRTNSVFIGCLIAFLIVFGGVALFALTASILVPNLVRARAKHLKEMQKPVQIVVEPYETLMGEGFSGSGFHFEWNGKRYIGSSLHQFDNGIPGEMILPDLETNVKIIKQVHKGEDVQILTYDSSMLDQTKPLPYRPDVPLIPGHPVILYHLDKPIVGHITRVKSSLDDLAHFSVDAPFEAAGCSGSPVISGITGTVIGIALTANDAEKATDVGFELLRLPDNF